MNDPEVIRYLIGGVVAIVFFVFAAFVVWLFCDRRIKVWWGNGGIDIDRREK